MKKSLFMLALLLVVVGSTWAQDKYFTQSGKVHFYSHTAVENIEATNHQASSYIDTKTGDVAVQMLVKAFKFDKALMEEHFNENYMESAKFPKADFKGRISNLADIDFSKPGRYTATISGKLTIHGTSRDITEKAQLELKDGKLLLTGKFVVAPTDFGIKIPSLVSEKIAKQLDVNVEMNYEPYKKK